MNLVSHKNTKSLLFTCDNFIKLNLHFILSKIFTESLGKWIMINLELSDLIVLISCDSNEAAFMEI